MDTLIVYATRHGGAEKCAKILSEKLSGNVDLWNLKEGKALDLKEYDKVIIGGSIYAGKIQKEVNEFCAKNLDVLKQKKIGLYVCGMLQEKAEIEVNASFPPDLLTHAKAKEFFGGEFVFAKMNRFERFIVKTVSKMDKSQPVLEMNKDISTISEEAIDRFANAMNHA